MGGFERVEKRFDDFVERRIDLMEGSQTIGNRDLEINELDRNMIFDRILWHRLIYVVDLI